MSRQATDLSVEKHHPLIPNHRERANTNKMGWIWIAGLVLILLAWGTSR